MKNIRDYIGKKYAVQCSSKEEWQKIMDLAPEKLYHTTNRFNESLAKIISLDRFGTYWNSVTKEKIEADGYTILPASDFLGVDMIAIQEEAKRRFPIGCKYKDPKLTNYSILVQDSTTYKIVDSGRIYAHSGGGCLYRKGEWAELISLPEETKKEMFYEGDYIVTLDVADGYNCARRNYCFKQRIDNKAIYPEVDLQGSRGNGHLVMSFGKKEYLKDWRYATPEEIAEYDRIGKPYDVTTLHKQPDSTLMTLEQALEECKRRYRKGMIVNSPTKEGMYSGTFEITEDPDKFTITGKSIDYLYSKGYLYFNGKFAEIVDVNITVESITTLPSYTHSNNKLNGTVITNEESATTLSSYTPSVSQQEKPPHIVNVQTTCVDLRTKTKNKYLTL